MVKMLPYVKKSHAHFFSLSSKTLFKKMVVLLSYFSEPAAHINGYSAVVDEKKLYLEEAKCTLRLP